MTVALPRISCVADLAATRVDVADDGADEIARRHHLDVHDRLEDLHAALFATFLHGCAGGDFERDRRRVDFVERAVVQRDLHVDQREADQNAVVPDRLDALFDARDVFVRGTVPPTTVFSNTLPLPVSFGSSLSLTRAN